MGRPVLLTAFLPEPSLNDSWKRLVGWRIALAVGLLGEHIVRLTRQSEESVAWESVVLVLLLYVSAVRRCSAAGNVSSWALIIG